MITKVDPAHDRTFEESRPEVEKQWRAEEVDKALAAKADDLVKQIRAGASVAEVAKSAGAEAKSAIDIHRDEKAGLPRIRRRRDLPSARRRRRLRRRRRTDARCSRSPPTRRRRWISPIRG